MKICVFSIKQRELRLTTGRNGYLSSFAKALNHLFLPNQSVFLIFIILKLIKVFSSVGKCKVSNLDGCHLA